MASRMLWLVAALGLGAGAAAMLRFGSSNLGLVQVIWLFFVGSAIMIAASLARIPGGTGLVAGGIFLAVSSTATSDPVQLALMTVGIFVAAELPLAIMRWRADATRAHTLAAALPALALWAASLISYAVSTGIDALFMSMFLFGLVGVAIINLGAILTRMAITAYRGRSRPSDQPAP